MSEPNLSSDIRRYYFSRGTQRGKKDFIEKIFNDFKDMGYKLDIDETGNIYTINNDADIILVAHYDTVNFDLSLRQKATYCHVFNRPISFWNLIKSMLSALTYLFSYFFLAWLISFRLGFWAIVIASVLMLIVILVGLSSAKEIKGMDDNMSGVLVLMKVAKMIQNDSILKRRVRFLFTNKEECGYYGSKEYVKQYKKNEKIKPKIAIVFDVVGRGKDLVLFTSAKVANIELFRTFEENLTKEISEYKSVSLCKNVSTCKLARYMSATPGSDHIRFLKAGIPAVLLMSGDSKKWLWWRYLYFGWIHTIYDNYINEKLIDNLAHSTVSALKTM